MNFNSYFLWPKKFVEDAVKAEKLQAFGKIVTGIGKGNLCKN